MATLFGVRFGRANVELLSLDESDAAKAATWEHGAFGRTLMSPTPPTADEASLDESERRHRSESRKQSLEGEKTIERIVGKAQNDGRPSKFPVPDGKSRSMLVVDARSVIRKRSSQIPMLAMPSQSLRGWNGGLVSRRTDGRPLKIIIMTTVIEICFQAAADLKPTFRRDGDVSQVKEPMDIGAQEQTVRRRMLSTGLECSDVSRV
jgi:hypothetical protein